MSPADVDGDTRTRTRHRSHYRSNQALRCVARCLHKTFFFCVCVCLFAKCTRWAFFSSLLPLTWQLCCSISPLSLGSVARGLGMKYCSPLRCMHTRVQCRMVGWTNQEILSVTNVKTSAWIKKNLYKSWFRTTNEKKYSSEVGKNRLYT